MLWAIEQRVDGIELVEPDEPVARRRTEAPPGQVVVTGARRYRYVPATTRSPPVAPVPVISDAGNVRRFVQGRLADLNAQARGAPARPDEPPASRPGRRPDRPTHRDPARAPCRGPASASNAATSSAGGPTASRCCGSNADERPRRAARIRLRFDVLEEITDVET